MREYEQLSGIAVDAGRVRYYRLNAFGRLGPWFGLPSMGRRGAMGLDGGEPLEVNRAADGSALILSTLQPEMRLDATQRRPGQRTAPPREVDQRRNRPCGDVTCILDARAWSPASGIARGQLGQGRRPPLKYLRELTATASVRRPGARRPRRLLAAAPTSLYDGRAALVDAVHDGTVAFETTVDYHGLRCAATTT